MKRENTVIRSIVVIILIASFCIMTGAGVTYALLNDRLSSDNNVIKSGVLEIDLQVRNSEGEYESVRKNDIPVVNYDRWESGYTQVINARIANTGTLALAYELEVVANGIVEAMMNNEPLLSDVIEVYYASSEVLLATREEFDNAVDTEKLTHVGNLTQLLLASTLLKDTLIPAANTRSTEDPSTDYITIVLKMHDSVSAEYQGLTVGDETFEFNLYAKQYTHESDSFDNQYDISKTTGVVFDDGQKHVLTDLSVVLTPHSEFDHAVVVSGENTVVEIYGGFFDSSSKGCAIWVKDGAKVIIYNGVFFCDGLGKPATELEHQTLIYAGDGGTVEIRGGYFASRSDGAWLLDRHDTNGSITVGAITEDDKVIGGGTYKDWNPGDNDSDGPHTNYLVSGTSILASTKGDATFYSINNAEKALAVNIEEDHMSLVGDLTIIDVPLFHDSNITTPTVIDGNGYTVDLVLYPDNPDLGKGGWYPTLSNIFSSTNGSKTTVNNITFTGTSHLIAAGDYREEARTTTVTEFNNVNIIDMELIQFSKWCTALNTCGTAYLNNCNVYGSTRSPLDSKYGDADASFAYDLVVSNVCKTYIDGGYIGNIYLDNSATCEIINADIDSIYTEAWNKGYLQIGEGAYVKKIVMNLYLAKLYMKGNAIIDELDLTKIRKDKTSTITADSTVTIGKIIDGEKTFTDLQAWKDWKATT